MSLWVAVNRSIAQIALCLVTVSAAFGLLSCGGTTLPSNALPQSPESFTNSVAETSLPTDELQFSIQSSRFLDADGIGIGLSAYDLIRNFGGPNPIESPDLYLLNHPEVEHIVEDFDSQVGNHFAFKAHRDIDRDRDRYATADRQRNEIKSYSSSEEALKGFENETLIFSWKFKIEEGMEVSRNFSHFFQLKAVGGNDGQPIITFTGNEESSGDGMEVRHVSDTELRELARVPWNEVTGQWLNAYVRATFSERGSIRIILSRMTDNEVIFDIDENGLDMWRGIENQDSENFVRPKWGIYRSLLDADNLRADEEVVRFANFQVSKVILSE